MAHSNFLTIHGGPWSLPLIFHLNLIHRSCWKKYLVGVHICHLTNTYKSVPIRVDCRKVFYLWNTGLITGFSKSVLRFWSPPPPLKHTSKTQKGVHKFLTTKIDSLTPLKWEKSPNNISKVERVGKSPFKMLHISCLVKITQAEFCFRNCNQCASICFEMEQSEIYAETGLFWIKPHFWIYSDEKTHFLMTISRVITETNKIKMRQTK